MRSTACKFMLSTYTALFAVFAALALYQVLPRSTSQSAPYTNTMSSSRVVVMTGATGSIGQAIATGLAAQQPTTLVLALRNLDKGKQLQQTLQRNTGNSDIHLEHVELDSSHSIAQLCHRVTQQYGHVNVLMNNAAVAPASKQYSKDNIEMQLAVNMYAYYLLAELLQPALHKGSTTPYGSRVVNVASNYAGHMDVNDLEFNTRRYSSNTAYMQSKQCNRVLSWQLAERYKPLGISVYSVHPGVVTSTLLNGLGMSSGYDSPEQGAATPVYAANDAALAGKTGLWLDRSQVAQCKFRGDAGGGKLMQYLEQLRQKAKL